MSLRVVKVGTSAHLAAALDDRVGARADMVNHGADGHHRAGAA